MPRHTMQRPPPTDAEIALWKAAYDAVGAYRQLLELPFELIAPTWKCGEALVQYHGPPWWMVECTCKEPKPCYHMAAVAKCATELAALQALPCASLPDNVLLFPGMRRG